VTSAVTKQRIDRTAPLIKVNGRELAQLWIDQLVGARIERGLCIVGRTVLRFVDKGYALSADTQFGLGHKVTIALASSEPLFSGLVTGAALEQVRGEHPELVITVDDPACRLGVGTRVATYENSTYRDVVAKTIIPGGISMGKVNFGTMQSVTHPYLLQRGSDLEFLDTLVQRAGCVWWVDQDKFNVAPAGTPSGTATVTLGSDLLEFSVRASGLRPMKVTVKGWDPSRKEDITKDSAGAKKTADSAFVQDYLGTKPKTALGMTAETMSRYGNANVDAEAEALATGLDTQWQTGAIAARGLATVSPALLPNVSLSIEKAGPSSGTYTVSEVEHVLRRDGFFTRFVAGPIRPTGLVDTLGGGPDRQAGFEMTHLTTGVVTEVKNEKAKGTVRVRFSAAGDTMVSAWARVLSLGGGADRGAVFHPEVNDEVLIGFERGDSRHPVVLGGLFSAKAAFAADDSLTDQEGKVTYRRVTSRMGHVIELGDGLTPDKQHLLLRTKSGHELRLGEDKFTLAMKENKPISITSGQAKFEIDAQGNVTIEGLKVTVKATQDVAIEATSTASLKGTTSTSVEGQQVEVKGTLTTVEGQGQLSLKGGMVMVN
jgi:uncharacterized protein involved in type VI secretion and phage assembly